MKIKVSLITDIPAPTVPVTINDLPAPAKRRGEMPRPERMNGAMNARVSLMTLAALLAVVATPRTMAATEPPTPATEPPAPAVSLQIHSARVTRASEELNKRFPGRPMSEGNPGVSLLLMLTLKEGTMLPVGREAVSVETFVDDTFQSLLATGNDSYGSGNSQTTVSEDGRALLFTVATGHSPAAEATRVFVRGSVAARFQAGPPSVATNHLPLTVGEETTVGPFHTVVRSVSVPDRDTRVDVRIDVEGDASRIQRVRVLDSSGKVLSMDSQPVRFNTFPPGDRPTSVPVILRALPKEPVTLEYTFVEKPEPVRIPFEAQVDIGVAKAGPVEPVEAGKASKRAGARTWPPPRETPGEALPPRRAAFNPDTDAQAGAAKAAPAKLEKATVDLFSITVAKAAPSEVEGVEWKTPPSPAFSPSGFTIARLLLSTPGASIVSVPPEGITITRFEDNKGGKLDTTLYRETSTPSFPTAPAPQARRSPAGDQMLLNLSLASTPTPGANHCTLTGNVQARVIRGECTDTTGKLELRKGEAFAAGPFKGTVTERQTPPFAPAPQDPGEKEAWILLSGPVARLRSVECLDSKGMLLGAHSSAAEGQHERADNERADNVSLGLRLQFSQVPSGPVTLRIRYYEAAETVQVPFTIETGIGL